ncbi:MAG TPA: hypothetical protein VNI78_11970 [Vicinamibacterales bacterium]|nr:hypothetical protein [Vicinamibacterales bacterium]
MASLWARCPAGWSGRSDTGITLIETTVILSVLFILAGLMSPIVSESVLTARAVKAKNDATMIAMGLINFQKDLGGDALAFGSSGLGARAVRLADVLVTAGSPPSVDDEAPLGEDGPPTIALFVRPGEGGGRRADVARRRRWLEEPADLLDDHLVTNRKGHPFRRPGEYGGWNGPYVSAEIAGDPWGNRYLVNTRWLDGGGSAADASGRIRRAVFVISAGANSVIETPFEQPVNEARPYGDDIAVRIQ